MTLWPDYQTDTLNGRESVKIAHYIIQVCAPRGRGVGAIEWWQKVFGAVRPTRAWGWGIDKAGE